MLLQGKVAFVTGAGSGIGREVALALASNGARVAVSDISVERGNETAAMIGAANSLFVRTDVSDLSSVQESIDRVVDHFGRLDIAHNNAGIQGLLCSFTEILQEEWARVIGINLTGVFYCMQAELRVMSKAKTGSIINTASILGIGGLPNQAHYIATKHGVMGLTKAAALEYAEHGIRVNAVLPGPVQTPLLDGIEAQFPGIISQLASTIPAKRVAKATDVAKAVVWLASDLSEFVNGAPLIVDGGITAHV